MQPYANHVQHIGRSLRATCRVPRGYGGTAQLLSLTELKFILALFHWLNHKPMKEGRKPEYPEKTPDDELHQIDNCY